MTSSSSSSSSDSDYLPKLLWGKSAPDPLPVIENGIKYNVKLGVSFSTGLFLDQRPQRAWLSSHCTPRTKVLNCFAHCGGFSVAAAYAGAETVSLDLDRKWLDRIPAQMEANGVVMEEEVEDDDGTGKSRRRHDTIYGDCFDWLGRLSRRGETYDVVILDPPSTSVGGKKKRRWSVRADMGELVTLASPLVKSGGLLFTTTNSASITAEKFAASVRGGLIQAGRGEAKLERICPMPNDFPSVGCQPVKNLVWRMP